MRCMLLFIDHKLTQSAAELAAGQWDAGEQRFRLGLGYVVHLWCGGS